VEERKAGVAVMANDPLSGFIRGLRRAALDREGPTDGELLEAYALRRDDAAFEALLRRHGAMVLGVCRRVLGNEADAEDAFQATFLVLVKKAARIRSGGLVGNWLYGVARNTALKARAMNRKRGVREREAGAVPRAQAAEEVWRQVQALLDEEVSRLPQKYRAAVVLCELQGKTIQEAARELGCPQGTLATRLARGRALLGKRLDGHGLALSAGVISAGLTAGSASAGVPPGLLAATADAARLLGAGQAAKGMVPAGVAALTEGVLKAMFLTRVKVWAAALVAAAGLLAAGAWVCTRLAAPPAGERRDEEKRPGESSRTGGGAATDRRELEGDWRLVDVVADGKNVSRLRLLLQHRVFHFQGHRFRVTQEGRDCFAPGTRFRLDPSRDPKAIDLIVTRDGETFTCLGIYSVAQDRLRLCVSFAHPSKRPRQFKPDRAIGVSVEVLDRVAPGGSGPAAGGPRGERVAREFAAILSDWARAEQRGEKALDEARTSSEREKALAESQATAQRLAGRCLRLAGDDPDGPVGLAALCQAAGRSPGSEAGKKALAALEGGRLARADLGDLSDAVAELRPSRDHEDQAERFALSVLGRVRRQLDHPDAARLLTWVCARSYHFHPAQAPRSFAGAADLIAEWFAASPDILNFCDCLGSVGGTSRVWARDYEKHLRTVLKKNPTRRMRAAAHFALARVVSSAGEARQGEAEELFRSFLTAFDGKDPSVALEKEYRKVAARELAEIQVRGAGKPAPEIEGEDLDGKPMKLSAFKGKVVLLSFWGTWCSPCMQFVPHERALVARLHDQPFALIGVNRDKYDDAFRDKVRKAKITWRSFKDRRPGKRAVSEDWGLRGWPTIYLIDHKGAIRKRWVSAPEAKELDREVDRLLEAAKGGK
jgi:RNA polymerase sigma factor (sigma-70 family)